MWGLLAEYIFYIYCDIVCILSLFIGKVVMYLVYIYLDGLEGGQDLTQINNLEEYTLIEYTFEYVLKRCTFLPSLNTNQKLLEQKEKLEI